MSRLILIRHAQSVADVIIETMRCDPLHHALQERLQQELITGETEDLARELHHKYCLPCGINDVGLTLESIQQISNLSRILAAIETRPKNIWCSPLRRARDTLEQLHTLCPGFAKATVVLDDRLIERQRGGRAAEFADLKLYLILNPGELARKRQAPSLHYAPPGGESMRDVQIRSALVLNDILAELHYGDSLVVSHHSVMSALRSQLEKWPESGFLTRLIEDKPPNCGAVVYNSDGDTVSFVSCSW